MSASDETLSISGHLRVFGCDDTPMELTVIPRSTGWRGLRAGALLAVAALAGALVIFPPHVIWVLAALVAAALAFRKWTERFTLVELRGTCPKCDSEILKSGPGRFRPGTSVDCPSCRHESTVVLPEGALED